MPCQPKPNIRISRGILAKLFCKGLSFAMLFLPAIRQGANDSVKGRKCPILLTIVMPMACRLEPPDREQPC